jgi:hypothetical protein
MSDWYELIGQTAVRIEGDIIECAMRFEAMDRRVAETKVLGMCCVSTIFLGLDHSWHGGPPVLFETMAFWRGEHGYEQTRSSTWLEAQKQHAAMCAEVARPGAVIAYIRRSLRDRWDRAKSDLWSRWREIRAIEPDEFEKTLQETEDWFFEREKW